MPTVTDADLATPLADVTFCAVDLETTGGSPTQSAITEIAAVKLRGGELLGSFQTLVEPGLHIPRFITHLTGIDDRSVRGAPSIDAVLPSLLEFLYGSVFVAHNARFDFGFLNVALRRAGYPPLDPPPVCTARLARRVVWEDVRDVRLQTLAEYFRSPVRPSHRALPDAEACAHVLHGLLDLGGRLGILTLGDLHESVRARGRPHYAKIRLADALPHARGVYLFRGRQGRVLYVGKATDLRARVKSYFYGDDRRKVGSLLAQTAAIEGRECRSDLEALVEEARLIVEHEPAFNRRGRTWRRFAYLKIDPSEPWARIKVARSPDGPGTFLGPFAGAARARLAKDAIEDAFAVRRCTRSMGRSTRFSPCVLADIGRCAAPCDGRVSPERYEELVRGLILSLSSPGGLLEVLEARMMRLAAAERYEEAALARDRLHAVVEAVARGRVERWLVDAGRLVVQGEDGVALTLTGGALPGGAPVRSSPCPPERVEEIAAVRSWLSRHRPRLVHADRPLTEPVDGGRRLHDLLARLRTARRAPDEPSPERLPR